MNQAFYNLPEEKQNRILNACMRVFSESSYKQASTDDMAAAAGISKGLLFYYFKNKKELYMFLFDYGIQFVLEQMRQWGTLQETDFFELIQKSAAAKLEMMEQHPSLYGFLQRAYYEKNEEIAQVISQYRDQNLMENSFALFQNVDREKFIPGVEMEQVLLMVIWMSEGYAQEMLRSTDKNWKDMKQEFSLYLDLLRRGFYKEEYQ